MGRIVIRPAKGLEARRIHALITANLEEGHLLPRTLEELTARAPQFIVATEGRRIVGCAELAPLGPHIAEVRSLVVSSAVRGRGVGTMIVDELRRRARRHGFEKLCAFTHAPAYFVPMGFSIVPHSWLLEKITADCVRCPLFRSCGKYAVVAPLDAEAERGIEAPAAQQPIALTRYA